MKTAKEFLNKIPEGEYRIKNLKQFIDQRIVGPIRSNNPQVTKIQVELALLEVLGGNLNDIKKKILKILKI